MSEEELEKYYREVIFEMSGQFICTDCGATLHKNYLEKHVRFHLNLNNLNNIARFPT